MTSIESLYPVDFREHERTRFENDQLLLPVIDKIKSGQNIEQLERFAKAYLGMYLDLDNTIPPNDRIKILANPTLAKDIVSGFEAVLNQATFPSVQQIVDSMFTDERPEGYILLTALDLFADNPRYAITKLPSQTVIAAICFHYAYKTEIHDKWLRAIMLQREPETTTAFASFWQALIQHGTNHLPGLYQFIDQREFDKLSSKVLLPVLQNWTNVQKKILAKLLHTALRTADHDQLLTICEAALSSWNQAEPKRYILWLATAFLLAPSQYETILLNYTGRTKEKIIPLVDFVYLALNDDDNHHLKPTAQTLAVLLRIIAPKITPQEDRYGQLCDNTRKLAYLFYQLLVVEADNKNDLSKTSVIEQLNRVRVMKLYTPILDYILSLQSQTNAKSDSTIDSEMDFEVFVRQLVEQGLIKPRVKRYD